MHRLFGWVLLLQLHLRQAIHNRTAARTTSKTLTLPGGYLVWNSAWPDADRNKMVDEAISKFLADWESLSR